MPLPAHSASPELARLAVFLDSLIENIVSNHTSKNSLDCLVYILNTFFKMGTAGKSTAARQCGMGLCISPKCVLELVNVRMQPAVPTLNMKRVVYLAGLISTEYMESLEWRKRIAPKLEEAGFEVRTPLFGKQNLKSDSKDGGITSGSASSKSICLRDRRDVREADIILAHLETFGSPRPLVGTIAELAWAWDQRTPVVAICNADNYLMMRHPFISEFVSCYVHSEEEALAFLQRYYGRG